MADPITRQQLDADIATEQTNLGTYIDAVNTFINSQQIQDFAAEDAQVQQMITNIQTAQGQLPPPQPKP